MKAEFEKARDEHLEKMWLEVEPFGFDHPDTYQFIQDRMDWANEWSQEKIKKLVELNVDCAKMITEKNEQIDQQAKIIEELKGGLERASNCLVCIAIDDAYEIAKTSMKIIEETLAKVKEMEQANDHKD